MLTGNPRDGQEESMADDASFDLTFPQAGAEAVIKAYGAASEILKYGSGGSTVLAALLGKSIVSVESDRDWAARMTDTLAGISDQARVHCVDIGETKKWGFPKDRQGFNRYHVYALSVWDRPDVSDPDLVLIDGRFRKACIAAVHLRARRPTTVLIDDDVNRDHYHVVEKLARREETYGRMARFSVTPEPTPPEMMTEVSGLFADSR